MWDKFRILREVSRSLENQWRTGAWCVFFYSFGSFFLDLASYKRWQSPLHEVYWEDVTTLIFGEAGCVQNIMVPPLW